MWMATKKTASKKTAARKSAKKPAKPKISVTRSGKERASFT